MIATKGELSFTMCFLLPASVQRNKTAQRPYRSHKMRGGRITVAQNKAASRRVYIQVKTA